MGSLLKLKKLWKFEIDRNELVEGLAFSDNGLLGVAFNDLCAYILDKNGNIVEKKCEYYHDILDVSYCCGKFGFIIEGTEIILVYDLSTKTWKEIHIGDKYTYGNITMLRDGFLINFHEGLDYFDFQGHKRWSIYTSMGEYIESKPVVYKRYIYIPRSLLDFNFNVIGGDIAILKLSDGSEIKTIKFGEERALSVQVCNHYLAVGIAHHVYLYDISDPTNPRELWKAGGNEGALQIAFSPDCSYILSAVFNDKKIHIFDINGKKVLEREFEYYVSSVAWWKDRIAVGLYNGKVYVYKVIGAFIMFENITKILSTQRHDLLDRSKEIIQLELDY